MSAIQIPTDKVESTNRLIPAGSYEAVVKAIRVFDTQLSWEFFIEGQGTTFQTQNLSHPVGLQVLAGTLNAFDLDVNKVLQAATKEGAEEIELDDIKSTILESLEGTGANEDIVMLSVKHRKGNDGRVFDNVSSVWAKV